MLIAYYCNFRFIEVNLHILKFTPFSVNTMSFDKHIKLYKHCYNLDIEQFQLPKTFLMPRNSLLFFQLPAPANHCSVFCPLCFA